MKCTFLLCRVSSLIPFLNPIPITITITITITTITITITITLLNPITINILNPITIAIFLFFSVLFYPSSYTFKQNLVVLTCTLF